MAVTVTELNLACCAVESAEGVRLWREQDENTKGGDPATTAVDLNVLLVAGTVTKANAQRVVDAYRELAEPKAVVAFGVCTITGGPYWDSYSVVPGIGELVPIDVAVPGCPPQPGEVTAAISALIVGRAGASA